MAKRPIVVIAGKVGAGKTTVVKSLLDIDVDTPHLSIISEEPLKPVAATRNGKTIHLVDTAGLGWDENSMTKRMREIYDKTEGKVDLLVYCMPVGPCHKVSDGNPTVMKCLTEVFGKKIWKKCILLLTCSNLVRDSSKYKEDEAYKACIKQYADAFQKLMEALDVKDNVTTIFQEQPGTIVAIPAGLQSEDPVLPGISTTCNWRDFVFNEILKRCDPEHTPKLLEWVKNKTVPYVSVAGAVGGIAAGAMTGIRFGGTPGMIAGAAAGGVAGGVMVGGAAIAKQRNDDKNKMKKLKEAMNDT